MHLLNTPYNYYKCSHHDLHKNLKLATLAQHVAHH